MAHLTDGQIDQLARWVEDHNRSDRWIARQFGVDRSSVAYHRLRLGLMTRGQRNRRVKMILEGKRGMSFKRDGKTCLAFTPAEDERMQALSTDGKNPTEIASLLGRPPTSVRMRLYSLAINEALREELEEFLGEDLAA